MTLHELTEQLLPHFVPSIQKDVKTTVRILAQALNYPNPQHCPMDACLLPTATLQRLVTDWIISTDAEQVSQGKTPKTSFKIRNAKNNISRLFRLAEAQQILVVPPPVLARRYPVRRLPPRIEPRLWLQYGGSYLKRADWPASLERDFAAFEHWASAPIINGRKAEWRKRPITLRGYRQRFEGYFGYLHHVKHMNPITFDHLFQFSLIESYVHWHINELHKRPTEAIKEFLKMLLALTNQYHPNPSLRANLKTLRNSIPRPTPFYNKSHIWLSLHEIERIGLALWPPKPPHTLLTNRNRAAMRAGLSLMLRLWVHIPYRQRNMREMRTDEHLYQTADGSWRIRFAGEALKVSIKRGKLNSFDLPFPPPLVETLQMYLQEWRPILAARHSAPEVFLTSDGHTYTLGSLLSGVKRAVYAHTGKHWTPHLIRTTWATEWISGGGDFMTAAVMLNDRLKTVIDRYAHLRDEGVAENAYEWVQKRINNH